MTTDRSALRRLIGKASNGRKSVPAKAQRRKHLRLLEGLEPRLLFSTDYVLSGNTLTTYTNGVAGAPVVVPDVNNVQITGDNTLNYIIVENFAGHVTVNGGGGGDQITVNGGGGGTVSLQGTTNSDQLVVRAPIGVVANITVGATQIAVGSDTINYSSTLAAVSVIGQLFTSGDTLTVNGTAAGETITLTGSTIQVSSRPILYYSTFTQLTVNGGGGDDAFVVNGDSLQTNLVAGGAGTSSFTVNTNSVALAITGGTAGSTTYDVNSNAGPLTITGQGAANTFNLNSSAAGVVFNGGTTINTYNVTSNSANLTVNGGGTANAVNIAANAGSITVNGGTGTDAFAVNTNSGSVTLKGGAGANTTYTVAAPTIGPVGIVGNLVGTGALTFRGTTLNNVFAVTASTLSAGTGATVTYANLTSVTVDGVAGNDTFLVTSSSTPTTLLGQTGNNTFNVRANTALTTINTGTGTNTINVGSNMPGATGNVLAGVIGGVDVIGSGTDVLNLNDAGSVAAAVVQLSTTGFTGVGGGITYAGLAVLDVKMGSGGNTLNAIGSPAGTVTGVNLGTGSNSVLITSTAPTAGGHTDDVLGTLNLAGAGADDLVIDDAANATPKTATLTPTSLTGLSAGTISFAGFDALTVKLGTAGNDLTITDTLDTAGTTIQGGSGQDLITLVAASGITQINSGGAGSTVAVRSIDAATTVTTAAATTIRVGSTAPAAGGVLSGIQAQLSITGSGGDTIVLDDTGNTSAATGTLSATTLLGFDMGVDGIAYANVATVNLDLGTGGSDLTVTDTASASVTNVTGNSGADTVTVELASGLTNVAAAGGDDVIHVRAIDAAATVDTGTGDDVVNVGSSATLGAGLVDGIAATLTIQGNTTAVLNVDDGGNAAQKTGTLTSVDLTGVSAGDITYAGIASLNLTLGTAGDNLTIASTGSVTVVDTGAGNDTVTVQTTAHVLAIDTGEGDDTVDVRTAGADVTADTGDGDNFVVAGSNGALGNGVVGGIVGLLKVNGGGTTEFAIDDWGNGSDSAGEMTGTAVTGLNAGGFEFHGVTKLVLSLGSGDDTFTVRDTLAGTTILNTNAGADAVGVYGTSGDTTVDNDGGADTVTVGDPDTVPGEHVMDHIAGALHLTGAGTYTLNLLDTGGTAAKSASVAAGVATGFSPAAVDFSGVTTLNVELGSGNNVVLSSPAASAATNLTTGAGNNTIQVRSIDSDTTLNLGPAANTVNVGSNAPSNNSTLDLINGSLVIHGGGADDVNLYDAGNAVAKGVTVNAGDVTGATPQPILFDGLTTLRLNLGSGDDTLVVTDSTAFMTLNAGGGNDTVGVRKTTKDITVQDASGTNTIRVGSLAPAAGGTVDQINGTVTVTSNVASTLIVDDSGNATGKAGTLTAGASSGTLAGVSPAAITFGIGTVDVRLGSGADTLNISGTVAFNDTLVSTGAGVDTVNVTSAGGVNGIARPLTVTGSGDDKLNVTDAGATGARAGSLTSSLLTLAGAGITYGGLSNLNVMFVPQTTFVVTSTAAPTSTAIVASGGSVTVGGAAASNVTAGVAGALSVDGNFVTDVTINDSADGTARVVTLTPTTVTGLSPATITYTEAKSLTVLTGTAGDAVTVSGTHGQATSLNTGSGADQISARATAGTLAVVTGTGADAVVIGSLAPTSTGGTFAGIAAAVTVIGGGSAGLTLDASAQSDGPTLTVTKTAVTGLNAGGVTYSGLSGLTVNLGAGNADVDVAGTAASAVTTLNLGDGNDHVDLAAGDINGPLVLNGSTGQDALVVTDTSASAGTVTLTPTTLNGLGAQVTYTSFASLNLGLGASRSLTVNDIDPATATTISLPSGQGQVNYAGAFAGQLTLSNLAFGSLTVGGDFSGNFVTPGGLQTLTVGGNLTGSATVGGNLGGGTIAGSLVGTMTVGGSLPTTLSTGGDFSGSLSVAGGVFIVTVGGDFTGAIAVGGKLDTLGIAGRASGTINVGTSDVITVGAAVPSPVTGNLLAVTETGVHRTIRAIASDGVAATGVTAGIVYDSKSDVPQAAIVLDNTNPGNRFDLILESPANAAGFNLTRVKGADARPVGVRNVNVAGDLINNGITAAQAAYFNEPQNAAGGVYLPADRLAAVAVTGNMSLWSIRATSIQAVGFSTITQKNGVVWSAGAIEGSKKWQEEILVGTLARDPARKQPFAKIVRPTETLRVMAGAAKKKPVALFIGKDKAKVFVGRPSYFVDQRIDAEPPVAAELTYAGKWSPVYPVITNLTFRGSGGSIDTIHVVKNITSTGPLGDVTLRGGRQQVLQSVKAQGMFGKMTLLDGGALAKKAVKGLAAARHR